MMHFPNYKLFVESLAADMSGEMVTLYRGDSFDIKNFSIAKTDPMALFGQGFYFTDNKEIAKDYTTKGSDEVLYTGDPRSSYQKSHNEPGPTKEETIDRYIETLAGDFDLNGNRFKSWLDRNAYNRTNDYYAHRSNPKHAKRIQAAEKIWDDMKDHVKIFKKTSGEWVITSKGSGIITQLQIPKQWLDKCLNAEMEVAEDVLEALVYSLKESGDRVTSDEVYRYAKHYKDYGFEYGADEDDEDPETQGGDGFWPTWRMLYTGLTADSNLIDAEGQLILRRKLKGLGYTGIRYDGGVTMGGRRHNAYVFWDEQGIKKLLKSQRPT